MITTEDLIKRTLRIPLVALEASTDDSMDDSVELVRRWDAALLTAGFKLSQECLQAFSRYRASQVQQLAVRTLAAVRELVGDHVAHNSYFIDFPKNVPDTMEFWIHMLRRALVPTNAHLGLTHAPTDAELREILENQPVNLLALPGYGTYQHTFQELVDAHSEFIPKMKDRITILHLGEDPFQEMERLFEMLASTAVPPSPTDRSLLAQLAQQVVYGRQRQVNFEIPGRETKAIINAALMKWAPAQDLNAIPVRLVQVDTITDVLRAVDVLSGGDGTLERPPAAKSTPARPVVRSMHDLLARSKGDAEPVTATEFTRKPRPATRLKSLRRPQRRLIMQALEDLLVRDAYKLADVHRHRQAWKHLGEGIHPHEFSQFSKAQEVFAVARGDMKIHTLPTMIESAFADGLPMNAARLMWQTPGTFARNLDRLLRHPDSNAERVLEMFGAVIKEISGRVLLSLIEHLHNRSLAELPRTFVTRTNRLYVKPDTRPPLSRSVVIAARIVIENELERRVDKVFSGGIHAVLDEQGERVRMPIVLDPAMEGVALPLSNKGMPSGLNVLPRGSTFNLDHDVLRFFIYWRQRSRRTDFDLSMLLLDADFKIAGHVSWTGYQATEGASTYSGDITDATDGATEFIDVRLPRIAENVHYIVPQVYIYSGENFGVTGQEHDSVAESFFGFMTMDEGQQGMPFEARAVHTKADMRGRGRVASPLVFERCTDNLTGWRGKWVHLYLRGYLQGGRIESEATTSSLLAQAMIRRQYLTVGYLVDQLDDYDISFFGGDPAGLEKGGRPITYVGLNQPEGLPEGSRVITPVNLTEIIPE